MLRKLPDSVRFTAVRNATTVPRKLPDSVRFAAFAALFCCCGTHPQAAADPAMHAADLGQERRVAPVQSELKRTMDAVAALRGWSSELSVSVRTAPNALITESMLADAHAQMSADVQEAQAKFLAAFGWVPFDFDIERDLLGRFAPSLAGMYCVTSRQILLSEYSEPKLARQTLRHEVVHAFQDTLYGLDRRTRWQKDRGDYVAAIHSLAEGEATCIERALDDPNHRGCLDPSIARSFERQSEQGPDSLPPVIRRSLASAYVDGVRYVTRLLQQGGWAMLEKAWNGGLQSTRQLMQESELPAAPLPLAEPSNEFGNCEPRYVDLIGDQALRNLVWEVADADALPSVLQLLVGERTALWRCGELWVAAMRLRFQRPDAARVFEQWLAGSASMDRGLRTPPGCTTLQQRSMSHHRQGQDIAIVSVLPRHGQVVANLADTCPLVAGFAVRLAGL